MKIKYYAFLLCLFALQTANAQWVKTLGPEELNANCISNLNQYLYLGTGTAGMFKSTNNATNWTRLNAFPDSASSTGIAKVLAHHDSLFAATQYSIYMSPDSGNTWLYAKTGIPDSIYGFNLYHCDNQLFATGTALDWNNSITFNKLYHFNDITNTWVELPNLPADISITSMVALYDTFFVAIPGHGIYKTHNYGLSWDSLNAVLGSINTSNVLLLATNGPSIYAIAQTAGTEILSSTNGNAWASLPIAVLGYLPVKSFAVSHDTLVIGSPGALTISTDGGNTWHLYSLPSYYYYNDIEFLNGTLFAADQYSGVASEVGLNNWAFKNSGLPYAGINNLAYPFSKLYALDYFSTFHTATSGNTWSTDSNICYNMHDMARMGNKLIGFYGTSQQNLVSWNQGLSWNYDTGLGANYIVTKSVVDNRNHKLYVFGQNDVRRSDDFGASWQSLFYSNGYSPHDTSFTALCTIRDRVFLIINDTGGSKLLYSDNFGNSWTSLLPGRQVFKMAAVDTVLVVASDSGIIVSPTLGNSFVNTYSPVNIFNTFVNGQLLFNYGGPPPFNLQYSADYGFNWIDISDPALPEVSCMSIDNNYLYAGTYSSSLWKRSLSNIGITYTPDTTNNYTLATTNIASSNDEYLIVYPNPYHAAAQVMVHCEASHRLALQVLDMSGRCVQEYNATQIAAGNHLIPLNQNLASGMYFIAVDIDGKKLRTKVVKQ